jgi:hypothetical protein
MSTAHHVRAQSRKEESNYDLTILAAASLSTSASCVSVEIFVVLHVSSVLATTVVGLLLATTTATSLLTTLLAAASWRLLIKFLALVMTSATHVSLEIVVLHFVICHVSYPPHVFDG